MKNNPEFKTLNPYKTGKVKNIILPPLFLCSSLLSLESPTVSSLLNMQFLTIWALQWKNKLGVSTQWNTITQQRGNKLSDACANIIV